MKTKHVHQIALELVGFNPPQTISGEDKKEHHFNFPETDIFKNLPAVWDETKVLSAEVGKYISVARRSLNKWFVCALTATEKQKLTIAFDFLEEGKNYIAHILRDDENVVAMPKVCLTREVANNRTSIKANLIGFSGIVIRLEPED